MNDVGAIESVSLCTTIGRRLAVALQCGIGFIFLVTAALKSQTPGPAYATIRHLIATLAPATEVAPNVDPQIIMVSLSSILVLEITLGVLLIARWRPRLTLGIAIGTLVVFSAVLGMLILDKSAPSCGCGGAVRLADDARTENILALGRNFLLIAACVWLRGRAAAKPLFP